MSIELWVLAASVVLLFVHISWQGTAFTKDVGPDYNMGAARYGASRIGRDRSPEAGARQLPRNLSCVHRAGARLADHRAGRHDRCSGAVIWIVARIVYLPLYAFGIPRVRSLAWLASLVGLALMLAALVF